MAETKLVVTKCWHCGVNVFADADDKELLKCCRNCKVFLANQNTYDLRLDTELYPRVDYGSA